MPIFHFYTSLKSEIFYFFQGEKCNIGVNELTLAQNGGYKTPKFKW